MVLSTEYKAVNNIGINPAPVKLTLEKILDNVKCNG